MFENMKLENQERVTKKSIKEQFEKILVTYPIARKQRPYELEEKHAKLVLMAQATSMTSPYSFDYCSKWCCNKHSNYTKEMTKYQ